MVAAAGGVGMSIEGWIQRWKLPQVFYNWQTLIAGLLAVLAAWRTIRATTKSADREVAASQAQTAVAQKQIATTLRLDRQRVAREVYAFQATIWAAMEHVLLEASEAESIFPARRGFSKGAFPELRAACCQMRRSHHT
jgi:endonuclease/exonuclease/phosphatase (EEP) superfamily protein YafD